MTTILFQFLALFYGFVLPGTLVALHVDSDWSLALRGAVGLMVGLLTVPMASFCAAWLLGTSVTPVVVLGAATMINVVAGGLLWLRWRRRPTAAGRPDADAPQTSTETGNVA